MDELDGATTLVSKFGAVCGLTCGVSLRASLREHWYQEIDGVIYNSLIALTYISAPGERSRSIQAIVWPLCLTVAWLTDKE